MYEGEKLQLIATVKPDNATDKSVTWTISDSSVASISSTGLITAHKKGSARIQVTCNDDKNIWQSCPLTVLGPNVPVTGVTVSPKTNRMNISESLQLTATVLPADASDKTVRWSSSDETVATVTSKGVVRAKAAGTAFITAETTDGKKQDGCMITVRSTYVREPDRIEIAAYPRIEYRYRDPFDETGMTLTAFYDDGSTKTIDDPHAFTVLGYEPRKAGTQTVKVMYEDCETSFEVRVTMEWWQWLIRVILFGWIWY